MYSLLNHRPTNGKKAVNHSNHETNFPCLFISIIIYGHTLMATSANRPFFLVKSVSHICALPLLNVVETMRPLYVDPLKGAPAFVSGVSIIRGAPVPVLELGLLLGEPTSTPCSRFVLMRTELKYLALAVQHVEGLREVDHSLLRKLPPLLKDAHPDLVEAFGVLDQHLLMVLQAGHIVPDEVWEMIESYRTPT